MYQFFRKNNKKLMAIFGAVLMVAFLIPTFNRPGPGSVDRVVGMIGTTEVHQDDLRQVDQEWAFLTQRVVVNSGAASDSQWMPIVALMPQEFVDATRQDSTAYYLLLQEARQMGMVPELAEADDLMSRPQFAVNLPDGRKVPLQDVPDEAMRESVRAAVADLAMVRSAFDRAVDVVKISSPIVQHEIALRLQQIKVRVVDFPAKSYEDKIGTPTNEDLQKQFSQFASTLTGAQPSESNPFGFGYQYPNRVKLQYVEIPRAEVRRAITDSEDKGKTKEERDYNWSVEAQKYYLTHQSEFANTAPASQPGFVMAPSTRPAFKPFDEVKDEVISRIVEPQVDRLALQIQSEITSKLTQDFSNYVASTPPTSGPTTAPLADFEYLQKLAADMQSRFKVTLKIVSVADGYKTLDELKNLEDIGKVSSFAEYAVAAPEPFVSAEQRSLPGVLKIYQPSRPMADESRNTYIFRVTAAEKSHSPASVDEVRKQVEFDWRRVQSSKLAEEDAQKLLDAAKGPGLDVVAGDHKVIVTSSYTPNAMTPIPEYHLDSKSQAIFVRDTFGLLSSLTQKDKTRPLVVIRMPADGKVAVAELIAVESSLDADRASLLQAFLGSQIQQQFSAAIANDWFNPASIASRVGFVDQSKRAPVTE